MPLIRKPDVGLTPVPQDDLNTLRTGSADARWAAARRLGAQPGSVALLVDALRQETDGRVREAILTALAHDGGETAIGAILPLIGASDAATRTGALDALATMPTAIGACLEQLLEDADPDVRILSCDLARRLPGGEANRLLVRLLERELQVNVCGAAVEVLSEVGEASALQALKACAQRFPDDAFITFAVELAIQRIGGGARTAQTST